MHKWMKLAISIVGCEAVGLAGTIFTLEAIPNWYAYLTKPSFAPPNWLFGPVWTILYALMGIALFLIWQEKKSKKRTVALQLFALQLILNYLWTPVFFGLRSPEFGLLIIVAMWAAIVATMKAFSPLSRVAAWLLLPYLVWVSFATLLNAGIAWLN